MFLAQDNPLLHSSPTPFIRATEAKTLPGLFAERLYRTPFNEAYRYYDDMAQRWVQYTWVEMQNIIILWQTALIELDLKPGDRVAVMLSNRPEWVALDIAAMGMSLVIVPLFANDRPENAAWCLQDSGARFLLVQNQQQWLDLCADRALEHIDLCVSLDPINTSIPRLKALKDWLPESSPRPLLSGNKDPDSLATICYTSGTTGHPKGVMLSHRNILWNADAGLRSAAITENDLFLSFLPLSHMLERTVGYYLPMMSGATVAYARSIPLLAEDLQSQKPTVLIAVPRIFERIHDRITEGLARKGSLAQRLFRAAVTVGWQGFQYHQGRKNWLSKQLFWPVLKHLVADKVMAKLGGRIRICVCGGARLDPAIAKTFIGLGLPLIQGYGLTETSPIVSVNRLDDNQPETVGRPLADVTVTLNDQNELLIFSPGIMLGYWKKDRATADIIDADGWLHSGDIARIDDGHITITGRSKDIIVLSTGEKICPTELEAALCKHPNIEQALITGEGQASLSALLVIRPNSAEDWLATCNEYLHEFPGYARIKTVAISPKAWTVENGLLTPTLKIRRNKILET